MKSLKSTILIISFIGLMTAFSSCERCDLTGIKGHGSVVSETLNLQEVQGIRSEIPATIYLTQGDEQSITIEAQQNILDNIERSVNNEVLKLKFDRDVSDCEHIYVYMTIKDLKEVSISGSGEAISESKFISEGNLLINVSGSGNAHLDADAHIVEMNIAGSGEIKLSSICDELYGNISGSGDINLEDGLASIADFSISGSGDIFAYNFLTEVCNVNLAGSGDSRVNASDQLTVSIAGSGDVFYKGNPHLSVSIAGSGDVINSN